MVCFREVRPSRVMDAGGQRRSVLMFDSPSFSSRGCYPAHAVAQDTVSTSFNFVDGNQLIQLREFAAKQRWELVAEFVDTMTGSGKIDRTAFDAMMLAASQRRFELLLFWKLDRFSVKARARRYSTSPMPWLPRCLHYASSSRPTSLRAPHIPIGHR
jgi:hypothetical protein